MNAAVRALAQLVAATAAWGCDPDCVRCRVVIAIAAEQIGTRRASDAA